MNQDELVNAFTRNGIDYVVENQTERKDAAMNNKYYSERYYDRAIKSGIPTLIKFATDERNRAIAKVEAERLILESLLEWRSHGIKS
jgi:transcriptional/translational regulatory protein YebC/TACO1